MSRKNLIAILCLGVFLLLLCLAYIAVRGDTYVIHYQIPRNLMVRSVEDFQVHINQPGEVVSLKEARIEQGELVLTVESSGRGRAYVITQGPQNYSLFTALYSHRFGIITKDTYFGDCTGGKVIPVAIVLYLALVLWWLIRKYRSDVCQNLYQYKNILDLGVIVFLFFLLIMQIPYLIRYNGPDETVRSALDSARSFTTLLLPGVFILSFMVTVSNLDLLRHEGLNWRNMIGCILGVMVCLGTMFPYVIDQLETSTASLDVYNLQGSVYYISLFVKNSAFIIIAYLECILIGTILFGFKAARHIPAFDKDYILILGCSINEDGSLTRLLRERAERAIEFATMQKKATGKDLVFVPSGGKGSDERIPEGEAIHNYLISRGIPESRILVEDRSANTYENMKYSMELIRETEAAAGSSGENGEDPKIAFSTTNYHVLRSGLLASEQGIRAEGIGSFTMSYFWVNAFVREFVATLVSEKRTHIRVMAILLLITALMVYMMYLSVNL